MAQVVFGGLPRFADSIQTDSGLDASQVVRLIPDISTLYILPYACHNTTKQSASLLCTLHNPITQQPSEFCCRSILARVVAYAQTVHNVAFTVGSELEFTLLMMMDDATASAMTTTETTTTLPQPVDASIFCQPQLLNQHDEFLSQVYDALQAQDIEVEQLHAESAPGQVEIVLRYCHDPVVLADRLTMARETISCLARQARLKVLWLPNVWPHQAGNGNHVHVSLVNATTGESLFAAATMTTKTPDTTTGTTTTTRDNTNDNDIVEHLHPVAQSFLEGILEHLPALLAITMPTNNSFRRVGAGFWTGSSISWAADDKESPLRVIVDDMATTTSWNHPTNHNTSVTEEQRFLPHRV